MLVVALLNEFSIRPDPSRKYTPVRESINIMEILVRGCYENFPNFSVSLNRADIQCRFSASWSSKKRAFFEQSELSKINIEPETIPFCINDTIRSPYTNLFVISPFRESISDRRQRFLLIRLVLTRFFNGFCCNFNCVRPVDATRCKKGH